MMIELIVKNWLESKLSVPVHLEEPPQKPAEYVLIEKTGSSERNQLGGSTVAVQSYAPSLYGAASLNELVKAAMEKIITLNEVAGVSLNSDYNFTDTETKRYRYQAVYDLKHY